MDIEAESVSERQADIEVDSVSVRGVSDTGEEVQRTVPAVEVGRSAEASEFAETTMLEDLYGDTIEEVDIDPPMTFIYGSLKINNSIFLLNRI